MWRSYQALLRNVGDFTQVAGHVWNNAGIGTWDLPPPINLECRHITLTVLMRRKTQTPKSLIIFPEYLMFFFFNYVSRLLVSTGLTCKCLTTTGNLSQDDKSLRLPTSQKTVLEQNTPWVHQVWKWKKNNKLGILSLFQCGTCITMMCKAYEPMCIDWFSVFSRTRGSFTFSLETRTWHNKKRYCIWK